MRQWVNNHKKLLSFAETGGFGKIPFLCQWIENFAQVRLLKKACRPEARKQLLRIGDREGEHQFASSYIGI